MVAVAVNAAILPRWIAIDLVSQLADLDSDKYCADRYCAGLPLNANAAR